MANVGIFLFLFMLPLESLSLTPAVTSSYISAPRKVLPGPLPTNSFKVTRNVTLGQCAAECSLQYHLKQFHCYAFEFVPVTRMCVLTNVTTLVLKGGYLGLMDNQNMNYFERSKGAYINLFQPYVHQVLNDQRTYFTIFHNMTLEKCALFCLLETRDTCMSFSYSEKKHVCGLSKVFYTKDNGQKLVTSDDYNHYQYFSSWPCNATIPWNYSPRAIASPYFPYASVTDVNCHLKIEAPLGRQIDLVFSTFFTQDDLCRHQNGGITIYDGTSEGSAELSRLCTSDNFVDSRFQSSNGYLYIRFATGTIPFAFKAVYDIIEVDPCLKAPCKNHGTCSSDDGLFTCTCMAGYTGHVCETDIDECESSPCLMGGKCVDMVNSFKCNCPNLLGGERCDKFVGLCYLEPCKNGGKCTPRGADAYICECPKGWSGDNCTNSVPDPCQDSPCKNGATCFPNFSEGKYACGCVPGFTGSDCDLDIDECASQPCFHNIPCTDLVNDYRCECPTFMAGKGCEQFVGRCSENPCQHGRCIPTGRLNYTCACDASYTGSQCDSLFINFCEPNPCKHGKCSSYENGPSCECDFGYDGFQCDHKINHCKNINCTHGECVTSDDGFHCKCTPGFEGKFCSDTINHCLNADCNGGYCINTMTSHFCVCGGGKTGTTCESSKYICDQTVCKHGKCKEDNGTQRCKCDKDFTGKECESPIDYCIIQPCVHGVCTSISGNFKCTCEDNYTGEKCEQIIDHCKDNKCIYGFCQNLNNSFQCICAVGYHGDLCQYKPNEAESTSTSSPISSFINVVTSTSPVLPTDSYTCTKKTCRYGRCEKDFPNVCLCLQGFTGERCENFEGCSKHNPCNHGNCSDTLTGFTCQCESGYEGELCEKKVTGLCPDEPCQNGGKCISSSSTKGDVYRCICQNGLYGVHCEKNILCDLYPCRNGTCVTSGDSVRCILQSMTGNGNSTLINIPTQSGRRITWSHHVILLNIKVTKLVDSDLQVTVDMSGPDKIVVPQPCYRRDNICINGACANDKESL